MTRSREEAGPIELGEEALGEIAGGETSYANSFQCIPANVSAGTSQADRIAGTSPGSPTLKG